MEITIYANTSEEYSRDQIQDAIELAIKSGISAFKDKQPIIAEILTEIIDDRPVVDLRND